MAGRWVIVRTGRHADTLVAPAPGVEGAAWHRHVPHRMGKGRVTRGTLEKGRMRDPFGVHRVWFLVQEIPF